jgi:iron complex outermembrane recepter protein
MSYNDMQVPVLKTDTSTGFSRIYVDNAAEATIQGLEVELNLQASDHFSVDATMSYLDTAYDEFQAIDNIQDNLVVDVSGNKLQAAPERAVSIGLQYGFVVNGWGEARLRGEYAYQSEVYFSPIGDDLRKSDGNYLVNVNLAFTPGDGNWNIALFGKNLTDERTAYTAGIGGKLTGYQKSESLRAPRTYGVKVEYDF